jgi:hypothetical protein
METAPIVHDREVEEDPGFLAARGGSVVPVTDDFEVLVARSLRSREEIK